MSENKDRSDGEGKRPAGDVEEPASSRSSVQVFKRSEAEPGAPLPPDPDEEAMLDELVAEAPVAGDEAEGEEAAAEDAAEAEAGAEPAPEAAVDAEAVPAGEAEGEGPDAEASPRRRLAPENLISVLESLLFVADRPLGVRELRSALSGRVKAAAIRDALDTIAGDYQHGDRGIVLQEVASGWQFRTNPENRAWVQRFLAVKPQRLSRAAMETLAIIAYRQPVVRVDIEEVRGVDSSASVKTLLERGLIRILGRKEEVGRPLIYGTSREFLEFFGLKDLQSLPTLKDLEELADEHREQIEEVAGPGFAEGGGAADALESGEEETSESQPEEEGGEEGEGAEEGEGGDEGEGAEEGEVGEEDAGAEEGAEEAEERSGDGDVNGEGAECGEEGGEGQKQD